MVIWNFQRRAKYKRGLNNFLKDDEGVNRFVGWWHVVVKVMKRFHCFSRYNFREYKGRGWHNADSRFSLTVKGQIDWYQQHPVPGSMSCLFISFAQKGDDCCSTYLSSFRVFKPIRKIARKIILFGVKEISVVWETFGPLVPMCIIDLYL